MKRKNVLKFVSLLSIGSFVTLTAASCTKETAPSQNTTSATEPSSRANEPSFERRMDTSERDATAARSSLVTLLASKAQNTGLYDDYAKIKDKLSRAYDSARRVLDSSSSTTQNLIDATSVLQTEINNAAKDKSDFDRANSKLVDEYEDLKTALEQETTILETVKDAKVKLALVALFKQAKNIVDKTLVPIDGNSPGVIQVTIVSEGLSKSIAGLKLANVFEGLKGLNTLNKGLKGLKALKGLRRMRMKMGMES
ncbi:FIVAR domain-containing protein [Mycoplasma tullyi]|uniref:FIVAR domain-containing protein n=1 Tax=Mycoplasma tullyi TaxID=1612150 RepID=A0A7D7XWE8_9MOLU|nr:FIVAR domain-containing protein [Mycoplasma tullyi]QMT98433.1 FIVAR domain-containing protein [Mycoplasma tullyi]